MKSSRKRLFRNHELPIRGYPDTSSKAFKTYLKPRDIPPRKAAKILNKLNSFNSAEQLKNTVHEHTEQVILSTGDAQQILHSKAELGEFHDLKQLVAVRRIGAKKFDLIVLALSN